MENEKVELSSTSLISDCLHNDLLVTDGVSIIGFWATTGKPQAIMRRPDSPEFGPQIEGLRNQLDFIDVSSLNLVDWVASKNDNLKNSRASNQEFISPFLVYENGKPKDPISLLPGVFR